MTFPDFLSWPQPPEFSVCALKDVSLLLWFYFWVNECSRAATGFEATQKADCKDIAPATEMHLRNFGQSLRI